MNHTKQTVLELMGRDPEALAEALARAMNDEARWAGCAQRLAAALPRLTHREVDRIMRENRETAYKDHAYRGT